MEIRNIKKEYKKYITIYFLLYFVIYIVLILNIMQFKFSNNIITNENALKIIYSVVSTPIISIISLVILNIFPTKIKNIIVFWKKDDILPSYRWKKIINNDDRVNKVNINNRFKKINSPTQQHEEWYNIYKKNENDTRILESQKDYLFARDLCIATIIMLIITFILDVLLILIFEINIKILVILGLILFLLYLLFVWVARNCANKFVINVIVNEIFKKL